MNLIGNIIVVPADQEQLAYQSLNVQQAGNQNVAVVPAGQGTVSTGSVYVVMVNPWLTDPHYWVLEQYSCGKQMPFIWQEEKAAVLESDSSPQTRNAILERHVIYNVYGRYNVRSTDPRFVVKTTNT